MASDRDRRDGDGAGEQSGEAVGETGDTAQGAATATDPTPRHVLAPDEAFAVLGDATRIAVLRALGAADARLSYTELFDRVDYDDSANFNYHLDRLVGHFVAKNDEGYRLRDAGRRVVEAVLAGAVTEDAAREPAPTDVPCPFCGAPVHAAYQSSRVELSCAECPGIVRESDSDGRRFVDRGSLGFFDMPPAGARGRTPSELLRAAWTWMHTDVLADSAGVCSRCSAPLSHDASVCADHDAGDRGFCATCGGRYAVRFDLACANCDYDTHAIAPARVLANTALLDFLTDHGVNPVAPDAVGDALAAIGRYDEEVLATDPLEVRLTFTVDGAGENAATAGLAGAGTGVPDDQPPSIALTLDDDLDVVAVERRG